MNGRIDSRFEVVHPTEGLVGTFATRAEAIECAERWAAHSGYVNAIADVRVFDVMANKYQANEWATGQSGQWVQCGTKGVA